ncbi:MAG: isoleucine--tRNA ligase [Alphaproteobacteria bacterium]|nr:isoleucine--tRNA ligase [Alphaproteobacteria bacterium]
MAYKKTEPKADLRRIEHEMMEFWRADDTFHKTLEKTKMGEQFNFYDGPPFANGLPHWGHLGVSAVKDMVSRYQTMRGRYVERALGWDCHGLPAEASVEKKQGRTAKDIVANDGIAAFCDMCKSDVMTYSNEWLKFIERVGRWVDGGDDYGYRTMDRNFMESVIWAIKEMHNRGLLYKDFKVNPFDWKLGTVLSNSEASSEYQDVVDDTVTVWFELENGDRAIAWTTTPWTLPANSALAVNPNMEYVRMKHDDGHIYVLAASRVAAYDKIFANSENLGTVRGMDLVGLHYTPLFPYYTDLAKDGHGLYTMISGDYVSDSDGTGIVHIAPAYGEDDYIVAKAIDPQFPVILNVDDYGNFDKTVADWAGENIFDANPKIIDWLRTNGRLVRKEQHKHSYPFGPRSKEKLIYRATDAWYVDVPKIRDRLVEITKNQTTWTSAGNRFLSWIENARPWGISRNRFWGVPLPIWERDGEYKIFGSVAELEEFFGVKIDDLHRPTLDKLTKDGWKRIPDVLDCWFESGSMPFASLHYPFENKDVFEKTFPADYIIEGQDQTRGWFYHLMIMAVALFDKPAFKTVSANGMVVDENKRKFSKSLGNFVNPAQQLETYGADAVRLFILGSNFMKAEPVPVDKEGKVFNESIKTILTPLWNAYHFFTLYANAGNIVAHDVWNAPTRNVLDEYILNETNVLVRIATNALDEYKPDVAVKEFVRFLDVLNNWYIRRSRARFWDEDTDAFNTLYTVLTTVCRVLAPFAPFISEYIYKNLTGEESVHLTDFPTAVERDEKIVDDMRRVQEIVSVGNQLREQYKLRNRLPLSNLTVAGGHAMPEYTNIIRDELNVKAVEWVDNTNKVADSFIYLITPKIGARLGGALRDIVPAVKRGDYEIDGDKLVVGEYVLNSDEFENRLNIRDGVTGMALPDNTAVVILDTELNSELIAEGLANDALRFIQDTRKAVGLDVSDRIKLTYTADLALSGAIEQHRKRIMSDALIREMSPGEAEHFTDINGYNFGISIEKV